MATEKKILIVGGGIGGLTLAACLKKKGISATVVEKTVQWRTIGYLIGLFPNGVSILKYLGIDAGLIARGKHLERYTLKDMKGKNLWGALFSDLKSDIPTIEIERSEVHFALVDANREIDVRMNTTVQKLVQSDDGVLATLSDGTTEKYDLVVGADGINSSVRKQIAPRVGTTYTGFTIWVAYIPGAKNIPYEVTQFVGERKFFSIFPSKNTKHTIAFFGLPAHKRRYDDTHIAEQVLIEKFHGLNPLIDEVLKHLPGNPVEIFHNDDNEVHANVWYKGRVALLGDAVHALTPLLGMGASMAMEDAYVLADELSKDQSIDSALSAYRARRIPRIAMLRKWSLVMHKILTSGGLFIPLSGLLFSKWAGPGYKKAVIKLIHTKP